MEEFTNIYKDIIFRNDVINYEKIFFIDYIDNYDLLNMSVIKINEDSYRIEFYHNLSSNLYYYVLDGVYIYSFSEEHLALYLIEQGVSLSENSNYMDFMFCKGKRKDNDIKGHHYNEIERISLYRSITIRVDGFDVEYIDDLFSVPIYDAADIIKEWIDENKKLVNDNAENIVPDLSAGLDTRSLVYFYKGSDIIKKVYTKDDEEELPIVKKLCERLGLGYVNDVGGDIIKLSGKGADIYAVSSRYLDEDYYRNNICHFKHKFLTSYITPYLNRGLLRIKPRNIIDFKNVIQYLLADGLMDIPYKSFKRKKHIFNDRTRKRADELLNHWKIEV